MTDRKPVDAAAVAIMVVLCAIWGSQQVAIKLVASAMSPLLQMGLRSGLAGLATLAVVLWRGEGHAINRGTVLPGLAIGMLFGTEFLLAGEALRFTSASHVTIYLYTAPIGAALGLGLLRPDERLRAGQWVGIALSFAGVVLAFSGGGEGAGYPHGSLGDALALGGACGWACTTLVLRNSTLANAPASVTLFYQLMGAFLLCTLAAPVLGETAVHVTQGLLASLGFQVVIVAFLSYLTWYALLRRYSAARLGVLSFMTPMFGVAAGVFVLGDSLDAAFITGSLMILAGIIIVSTAEALPARLLKWRPRPALNR
ncbi:MULTISPECIES: DMT family transporter [unclassified Sphingomonas]|uniref:DMT family transporter n=1 Tax=Novosphingobium rhizosphaerae TaxID=1551649 RepID=UPI0015C9F4C9